MITQFLQALKTELTTALPQYVTEVREPFEGELKADALRKQIFVTTEGFEFPEPEDATLGERSKIMVPILVSIIMQRPRTEIDTIKTLVRRLTVSQACMRAVRDYSRVNTAVNMSLSVEQPTIIEGYLVSIVQITFEYDLVADAEENQL